MEMISQGMGWKLGDIIDEPIMVDITNETH